MHDTESPLTIGPMTAEDAEAVAAIETQSFSMPRTAESFLSEMRQDTTCFLVARIAGKVVGHIGLWLIADESHIITLAVHPEHRGRKIGEGLLVAGIAQALSNGAKRITLEVRSSNESAQALYRKYGFVPVALRKGYYQTEKDDGVVMWVDQIDAPHYVQRFQNLRDQLSFDLENSLHGESRAG
ncbi:MAG: ribosomal protein S18-alanine N-acetyltransferase [Armatimonadetes bacterium]|nr:ribosomal protein S18-alanine N-acetyltransferase [Armatimonadota bacterium]